VLVVILILWNRSKHRANIELAAKNKLILNQKDELVKLNASKDKFLSILAHDIKNPLGAILGISDILNSDYPDLTEEERKGFIKDIHTSSTNLFEIINTLLNWSISQNGMISYQPREFTIGGLCQTSINKLQSIAKLKDVSLVNQADEKMSVFADDNMIMTVLHNLICNAIKFSHRGGEILLMTEVKDGMAEVSVVDSGVGISAENQAKLFRYDQSYRSKGTSGETGTGIGLILCKDFIERNNGRIWVESEVNKGSKFKFTLPIQK
jgi:signal transduction histidine kinase